MIGAGIPAPVVFTAVSRVTLVSLAYGGRPVYTRTKE
jgi:hypothetical protein